MRWRIAIINGIWDGKGYEQVTKTMGSNSQHGCNVCDFHGIYFGNTQKYPFYYRYTSLNDSVILVDYLYIFIFSRYISQ